MDMSTNEYLYKTNEITVLCEGDCGSTTSRTSKTLEALIAEGKPVLCMECKKIAHS